VIEQATMLDSVAEIVRRQSEPCGGTFRRQPGHNAGEDGNEDAGPGAATGERSAIPPLSSRIIRAVNAFDDLVGSSADPARGAAVVDRLRLDASAEYDPDVVVALSRIIARRSVLPA
jgi:hypothetical protein